MRLSLIVMSSLVGAVIAESHAGKRADHAGIAHKLRASNDTASGETSLHKRNEYYGPPNQNNRYTYYAVGLGACGDWNVASDYIVAMNSGRFQQNGGYSIYPPCICGMQISISYGGNTATATVKDECPTCPGIGDLDLSQGLFESFASTDAGELWGGSWTVLYDPCNPNGNSPSPDPQPAPAPTTSQYNPPPDSSSSDTPTPTTSSTSSTSTSSSSSDQHSAQDANPTDAPQNLVDLSAVIGHLGRIIWQAAGRQGDI